jgi:hypothetical protein
VYGRQLVKAGKYVENEVVNPVSDSCGGNYPREFVNVVSTLLLQLDFLEPLIERFLVGL